MAETKLNRAIEEAYTVLKELLSQRKYRITNEEKPHKISAIQGSLWGTTPKTAQKTINFTLQKDDSGTRITGKSSLTSGYIGLTVTGVVFSVALIIVCIWIILDLQTFASTGASGFWGWLARTQGFFNPDKAALFTGLLLFLTAFLTATLIVETAIVVSVKTRINATAEEVFKTLVPQW